MMEEVADSAPWSWLVRLSMSLATLLMYPLVIGIYNLYLHPLAGYPGPWLWQAFRAPFALSLLRGEYVRDIYAMHERWGDVVRVAPNELSFACFEAWQDIHCPRPGHRPFPKDPLWWGEAPGRAPSLIATPRLADHERMRDIIQHCFSMRALRGQEASVQFHADLLVQRLRERMDGAAGAVVDVVDWYMFYTFDVLGDLAFSSSFECLQHSRMHPWVRRLFNYFHFGAYIGLVRLYLGRGVDRLLMWLTPRASLQEAMEHYQWAVDKVHRRMNLEVPKDDFMTYIMENNKKGTMSMEEIESNAHLLIVAGSETCGTVLAGTTNYLIKSPAAYAKLKHEIRGMFARDTDLTFASLQHLPYLNAVIEEGLRMCPPMTAGLPHVVPVGGDTVLGKYLPEGTGVSVHNLSTSRGTRKFYKSNEFLPERWLPEAKTDPASPFYHDLRDGAQAYSIGSWSCIGRVLAQNELRVVIAKMVWWFDMSVAEGGRDVEWADQKCWFLVKKEPFDVRLIEATREPLVDSKRCE